MTKPNLRIIRPAPLPLGLYIRTGKDGRADLENFILANPAGINGLVVEAKRLKHQKELMSLASDRRIDLILDPQTQAMAQVGGYKSSMDSLPWSKKRIHTLGDFSTSASKRELANLIAQFVIENKFTQVLAPTHLISGADDPWLEVDMMATQELRLALDRNGARSVDIAYSLALSYECFRTEAKRQAVLSKIEQLPANSVWLAVDGCGARSSPLAITKYCDAARDFHSLDVPLVADHMGGIPGLALLAFGAVGGIAHGQGVGERFNCGSWRRIPQKGGGGAVQRYYVPSLDMMLKRDQIEKAVETAGAKARSIFLCRNTACCPTGYADMMHNGHRHFLFQRIQEVNGLSQIPETLRPRKFLEDHVRAASDYANIAQYLELPEDVSKAVKAKAKELANLRLALSAYDSRTRDKASYSKHPLTLAARG